MVSVMKYILETTFFIAQQLKLSSAVGAGILAMHV